MHRNVWLLFFAPLLFSSETNALRPPKSNTVVAMRHYLLPANRSTTASQRAVAPNRHDSSSFHASYNARSALKHPRKKHPERIVTYPVAHANTHLPTTSQLRHLMRPGIFARFRLIVATHTVTTFSHPESIYDAAHQAIHGGAHVYLELDEYDSDADEEA